MSGEKKLPDDYVADEEDEESSDSVVIKRQDEIRIYANQGGGITIEQKCWPDTDQIIVFGPENAEVICEAIDSVRKQIMRG